MNDEYTTENALSDLFVDLTPYTTEGLSDLLRDLTPPEVTSKTTLEMEKQFRCWSDKTLGHVDMGRAPRPHVSNHVQVGGGHGCWMEAARP